MISNVFDKAFIRFLMVGGGATVVQFLLLLFFVECSGLNKVASSVVAFSLSAMLNYLLNYYITFKGRQPHRQAFPKFLVVVALGLFINTCVFAFSQQFFHYVLAQAIATVVTVLSNFVLHKFWIYADVER